MDILRFAFLIVGFFAFLAALVTLVSHSVVGLDFLHAGNAQSNLPMSAAFLSHVVAAIMLSGVGYLLVSIGRKGS